MPSATAFQLSTKTFAARQELKTWGSARPPPGVPAEDGPHTRRMEETEHELPATHPDDGPARDSHDPRPETVATRPLETPVALTPARSRPLWPIALVAVAVLGGLAAMRGGAGHAGGDTPVTTGAPAPSLPQTGPSPTASPPASAATGAPSAATASTGQAPGTTPTPPGASTAAPAARAHLALFGDPGTLVAVDGTPRGRVPLRDLALEPGAHDVLFTFETTGERRGDRVTLRPGEKVRLRADFTGAVPTIRVER
jgi:hypothetical protein